MFKGIRDVLDRCKIGFPLWQKCLMTVGVVFYGVFPIDVLPDVFPPFTYADDAFMVWVLVRVWRSPTLAPSSEAAQRSRREAIAKAGSFLRRVLGETRP